MIHPWISDFRYIGIGIIGGECLMILVYHYWR